jgi:hypothetical protein
MGNTLEGIETVIKCSDDTVALLAEQSDILMELDPFAIHRAIHLYEINEEINDLLVKQKDTLVALKDYILACGAKESKITKRWGG